MSIQGTPRMDRDTAARLVDGHGAGPVAVLLRAAAAPAHKEELAGEDVATAAFRSAALGPVPGRPSVIRRTLTKALVVKGVLVLAIAGSTGVVLAASEGALPVPWSDRPAEAPGGSTTSVPPTTTPEPGDPDPKAPGGGADEGGRPAGTPDPSIAGLCDAYTSGDDKDLGNPAFGALADAAGGPGRIPEYCASVEPSTTAVPGTSEDADEQGQDEDQGRTPVVPTPTAHPSGPSGDQGDQDDQGDQGDDARTSRPGKASRTKPMSSPTEEETVTQTPDSSAPGAATAVPPSGAEPPSVGD